MKIYTAFSRSEMQRSEIELAWRKAKQNFQQYMPEKACFHRNISLKIHRLFSRSEMQRSEIELAWRKE